MWAKPKFCKGFIWKAHVYWTTYAAHCSMHPCGFYQERCTFYIPNVKEKAENSVHCLEQIFLRSLKYSLYGRTAVQPSRGPTQVYQTNLSEDIELTRRIFRNTQYLMLLPEHKSLVTRQIIISSQLCVLFLLSLSHFFCIKISFLTCSRKAPCFAPPSPFISPLSQSFTATTALQKASGWSFPTTARSTSSQFQRDAHLLNVSLFSCNMHVCKVDQQINWQSFPFTSLFVSLFWIIIL